MKSIVADSAGLLRDAGFRKRRHSFNRRLDSGLVHVAYFWMAPKEPPAWTEVPGLRERRYGGFRLDFGVWVPEITRSHTPRSTWINEYDCHLRATIGWLITGEHVDFWWQLDNPDASALAQDALTTHGLPWLDDFPDQAAILTKFLATPTATGLSPAGALDLAQMCHVRGDHDQARQLLEAYAAQPHIRSHISYLQEYLPKIGHGDLVDRLIARPNKPQ